MYSELSLVTTWPQLFLTHPWVEALGLSNCVFLNTAAVHISKPICMEILVQRITNVFECFVGSSCIGGYDPNSLIGVWIIKSILISMVSCQKGPTRHAYAYGR